MQLRFLAPSTLLSLLPFTASAQLSATLQVSDRNVLDRCGTPIVLRGLEQNQRVTSRGGTIINGSWNVVVDLADTTRANEIRIIPDDVTVAQTRTMVQRAVFRNMIVELHTSAGYYAASDVQQMVAANKTHMILGIMGEPDYDDRTQWQQEAMSALNSVRALGYDEPVLIMANNFGRDLPSILNYGQTLVNADPLHKVILGWQAYWGQSNGYQNFYGMTFQQAMAQIVSKHFPVQVGITYNADNPPDPVNYSLLMSLTRQNGISSHFWDYYSRNAADQNMLMTSNAAGTDMGLTDLGQIVLQTDPNSFWNQNAPRPCTSGATPCYANCDGSTVAPILNANDFQCFLGKFAAGDAAANCDQSSAPPVLNANDFQCFLTKFATGCP
jgi:hypothetical protein